MDGTANSEQNKQIEQATLLFFKKTTKCASYKDLKNYYEMYKENTKTKLNFNNSYISLWLERWFFSSNAKDIGTLYLILALLSGLIGTAFSVLIRLELSAPGVQFIEDNQLYNSLITAHALVMIFFMVMPAMIGGFGNFLLPLLVGGPDMAKQKDPYPLVKKYTYLKVKFTDKRSYSTYNKGCSNNRNNKNVITFSDIVFSLSLVVILYIYTIL